MTSSTTARRPATRFESMHVAFGLKQTAQDNFKRQLELKSRLASSDKNLAH
jgi:hypothetical protein